MKIIDIHLEEFKKRDDLLTVEVFRNIGSIRVVSRQLSTISFDIEYNSETIKLEMKKNRWSKTYDNYEHMVVCKIVFYMLINIKKNIDNINRCFDMLFDGTVYENGKLENILDEISKK